MRLDRRQFLATGGLYLAWCGASGRLPVNRRERPLDSLLEAHADVLPERAGAGANHYPMAAEALEALGYESAIEDSWRRGAAGYAGELPRAAAIQDPAEALGAYDRYGDWLDYFRGALEHQPWRSVIAAWTPRLAPGISAAAFHGVIRTGHAARALRQGEAAARRSELAAGLAYWASRYIELPMLPGTPTAGESIHAALEGLEHRGPDDRTDVDFDSVMGRLVETPIAPPVTLEAPGTTVQADLDDLVRAATTGFLEMLILERHRIWLLHTITGPAAVGLLLPEVDPAGARKLVAYARQAVVAMYSAFGAPYRARAHVRASPPEWPNLISRAVDSRSVHTIKLIEALVRFDDDGDSLHRSVAAQWLEWT